MNLNSLAFSIENGDLHTTFCIQYAVLNDKLRSPLQAASEKSTVRKMIIMTTIDQLVGITGQCGELVKRVGNGSLDPTTVKRALQDIIEGKQPTPTRNPPTWWRTPEQQLARARQLWPHAVLPEPPKGFAPRTKSEVLLLHVPDSFDSLWDKVVVAPTKDGVSWTKDRWDNVKSNKRNLRLAPNKREFAAPVWLAFDPEHGEGKSPDSFWSESDIAASEVLSALIQFPDWPLAWFNDASIPNLAGYRLKYNENKYTGNWSLVPYLSYFGNSRLLHLRLSGHLAGFRDNSWSSPSVREC